MKKTVLALLLTSVVAGGLAHGQTRRGFTRRASSLVTKLFSAKLTPSYLNFGAALTDDFGNSGTFTRASTKTCRTSATTFTTVASGAPCVESLGTRTNYIAYSAAFENAWWAKGGGGVASAPVVTADAATAPDGSNTADQIVFALNGGTTVNDLSIVHRVAEQPRPSTAVTWSIWMKTADGSTKSVALRASASTAQSIVTVTGAWQRFSVSVTTTSADGSWALFGLRGTWGTSDSATLYVWGAQWEDGSSATAYVATSGYARAGEGAVGVLMEQAATNVLLQSETLDNVAWANVNTPIVTANTWDFGTGSATGETINDDDATTSEKRRQAVATTTTGAWTASCFMQSGTTTLANMVVLVTGGTGTTTCNFSDLSTTTQRKTCTITAGTGVTQLQLDVGPGNVTADTGTIKVGGCQLETGSVATSYIQTLGTQVTRSADALTFPSANLPVASGEVCADATPTWWSTSTGFSGVLVETRSSNTASGILLYVQSTGLLALRTSDGTTTGDSPGGATTWTAGVTKRVCGTWGNGQRAVYADGVLVSSTASGAPMPISHSGTLNVGINITGAGSIPDMDLRNVCFSAQQGGCR